MKNTKKDAMMILILMAVGGFLGFVSSYLVDYIKSLDFLNEEFTQVGDYFVQNVFWYQLGVAIFLLGLSFYWIRKSRGLLKSTESESDEEIDRIDKAFDRLLYRSLLCSNVYFVVAFILFGVAIDRRNPLFWGSLVVFIVFVFISIYMDTKVVRYIQTKDPMKKGNPTSIKFGKEWLDSCDEAERMMIYKAAYETFTLMQNVLIGIFLLAFLSKVILNTGNYPIFLMGSVWLIHSLSYFYYAARN